MRDYIPIEKDSLPEQFEIDLGEETFIIGVNYNTSYDFFTVDLYDANQNVIVLGEKMVLNTPLWSDLVDERLPAPSIVPMDEAGQETKITFKNFMVTTFLYIDDVLDIPEIPILGEEEYG